MPEKVAWIVDSKTDTVNRYVDNGVFYDGRQKTLQNSDKNRRRTGVVRKSSSPTGSKNITQFIRKEGISYNDWMKR